MNINRKDVIITILVAGLVYMLNQHTAIYQCAAIFTAILFIINTRLLSNTAISAYKTLLAGIAVSLPLYAMIGTAFSSQMTAMSLISLLSSGCVSIYITNTLNKKYSFPTSLLVSLITVAMIDGLIMKSYFSAYGVFSVEKIGSIFNKELSFKVFYATGVYTITYIIDNYKRRRNISN